MLLPVNSQHESECLHVWRIRGQLSHVGFLLPPHGSQLKYRLLDLAAVPFPAEPLCQPLLFGFEAEAHVTQVSLDLDKSLR